MKKKGQCNEGMGSIMCKIMEPINELIAAAEEELMARAYLPEEQRLMGAAQALVDRGLFSKNIDLKCVLEMFDDLGLDNPYKNKRHNVISFEPYKKRKDIAKRKHL